MNIITLINRIKTNQEFTIINHTTGEIILNGFVLDFYNLQNCVDYDFRKFSVVNIYCNNNKIIIEILEVYNV